LQDAAVQFVKPEIFTGEMKALQQHFVKKRDYVVERFSMTPFRPCQMLTGLQRLNEMGLKVAAPDATFYIWVNCIAADALNDLML
jgi:hypothetical protein